MSLIYCPGMSRKGDAKLTATVFVRTVVSGAVPGTSDAGLWGRRLDEAFTAALAASVAISLADCFTVSVINCWIVCIWPSVNSGSSCLCAVVSSMFGAVDPCSLMFCWVGGGLFSSRSRRSRVFRTPVDCIPCWTQRERRLAMDRAPNVAGSIYICALGREVDRRARGGMICGLET